MGPGALEQLQSSEGKEGREGRTGTPAAASPTQHPWRGLRPPQGTNGPGNITLSLFFSAHFMLGWVVVQERPHGRAGLPSLPGFPSPEEAVRGSGGDEGVGVLLQPLRVVGEAGHWPNKPSRNDPRSPGTLLLSPLVPLAPAPRSKALRCCFAASSVPGKPGVPVTRP